MNDEAIEIELIEEIEFENKRELLDKEAYYMTQYDCLNKRIEDGKWKERKYKRQKEKIQCECGVYSTIGNISAHRKTKKHQSKLK